MKPRSLLSRAGVRLLCTTDDPLDDLSWHIRARQEVSGLRLLPSFRPDRSTNILRSDWNEYVKRLATSCTCKELSVSGIVEALHKVSDHGLNAPYGRDVRQDRADDIFRRATSETTTVQLSEDDAADWASFLMDKFASWNKQSNCVMLVHFGAYRNANSQLVAGHGPDVGADVMSRSANAAREISPLLSKYCGRGDGTDLKLVLAPIDPSAYPEVITITRAFAGVCQIAPWWFTDTYSGIVNQLEQHIEHGFISSHFGMVCDGRKLTSIAPRFEMYDRALREMRAENVQLRAEMREQIDQLRSETAASSARIESKLDTVIEVLTSQARSFAPLMPLPGATGPEIQLKARRAEIHSRALSATRSDTVASAGLDVLVELPLDSELQQSPSKKRSGATKKGVDEELQKRQRSAQKLASLARMAFNWSDTNLELVGSSGATGLAAASRLLGIDGGVDEAFRRVSDFAASELGKELVRIAYAKRQTSCSTRARQPAASRSSCWHTQ